MVLKELKFNKKLTILYMEIRIFWARNIYKMKKIMFFFVNNQIIIRIE